MERAGLLLLLAFVSPATCEPLGFRQHRLDLSGEQAVSPENRALLRAAHAHQRAREITVNDWQYDIAEEEAWHRVLSARKFGPHSAAKMDMAHEDKLFSRTRTSISGGQVLVGTGLIYAEWCFLALLISLLLGMDVLLLQQLPETQRSHVTTLSFWLFVAFACCVEVWACAGAAAGATWLSGYMMELISSVDNVFIMQLIFSTLETPYRLMSKALFIGMVFSIGFRLAFFSGLARMMLPAYDVVTWMLGTCLVYSGVSSLTARNADVTESRAVRVMRKVLGSRLAEFYDEETEAVVITEKGKNRITLLGTVLLCMVSTDFFVGLDVALAKSEAVSDTYLNFSSSALAMFAIRALFFVVRDFFNHSQLTSSAVGVVLLVLGSEMLAGHAIHVNALTSALVIASIMASAVAMSYISRGSW
eukprot:CAMPEP_0197657042 /NCGR_PEP_ID=MMETSP1338-20131121/44387_1 /TAXON_ID=43686 ORGANISM="Pelagodinium beii, Strain RCC1491" /NCGR_SAMPLE_ID=MMETSP1338 /ASSEMBLY_ACC=CAM_ASM_000754 /LENGTH=417 /DNA_ID=CAMNT_0043233325 /DNA_START=55 /DNA_END=1305 /DNA_ORIENTATION=-